MEFFFVFFRLKAFAELQIYEFAISAVCVCDSSELVLIWRQSSMLRKDVTEIVSRHLFLHIFLFIH